MIVSGESACGNFVELDIICSCNVTCESIAYQDQPLLALHAVKKSRMYLVNDSLYQL